MQFRCTSCTKTIALAASGELPAFCPHCSAPPGPGPLGPYDVKNAPTLLTPPSSCSGTRQTALPRVTPT